MGATTYEAKDLINKRLGRYNVIEHISSGGFAHVYKVENAHKEEYALKVPIKNDKRDGQESILKEYTVYKRLLNGDETCHAIPFVRLVRCKDLRCLEMPLLSKTLDYLVRSKTLTPSLIVMIACKMIDAIKFIHKKGYIHKDLTPNNFLLSANESGDNFNVFMIDFGLAKPFLKKNGHHIDYKEGQKFEGTWSFCSINSHHRITNSRRDDLESFFYILIYLFKGYLPWQNIKHKDKDKRSKKILHLKETTSIEDLCKGLHPNIVKIGKYIRQLTFEEKPKYKAVNLCLQEIV